MSEVYVPEGYRLNTRWNTVTWDESKAIVWDDVPVDESSWRESEELESDLFEELFTIVDEAKANMENLVEFLKAVDCLVLEGWSYDEAKFAVACEHLNGCEPDGVDDLYDRFCNGEFNLYDDGFVDPDGSHYQDGTIVDFS